MAPRNRRGERTGRMGGGTKVGLPGSSKGFKPIKDKPVRRPGPRPGAPKRPTKPGGPVKQIELKPKRPTKPGKTQPGKMVGKIKGLYKPKKLTGTKRPVAGRPSRGRNTLR